MTKQNELGNFPKPDEHTPVRVRLPGFVNEEEIGLGDVIKRATAYLGVQPCEGCHRRAAALNRRIVFTGPKLA